MKSIWLWLGTRFWWLWGANLFFVLLVGGAFALGWSHETITGPNIPAWCAIFLAVAAVPAVGFWLHSAGRRDLALWSVLMLPLPLLLYMVGALLLGILYFLASVIGALFGHGRVN